MSGRSATAATIWSSARSPRPHDLETTTTSPSSNVPILAHTAGLVGDRQVRHRGTVGPFVCARRPGVGPSDDTAGSSTRRSWPRGRAESRQIAAADFFQGFLQTALAENEVLTEIHVPKTRRGRVELHQVPSAGPRLGHRWRRRAVVERRREDRVHQHGADPDPRERSRGGLRIGWRCRRGSRRCPRGSDPPSDTWASADFRRHLAQVLTGRALAEAAGKSTPIVPVRVGGVHRDTGDSSWHVTLTCPIDEDEFAAWVGTRWPESNRNR